MHIAYLGPEASYTHQAARQVANRQGPNVVLQPKVTIEDVFIAVQQGEVDRGVVPLENSSNGSVVFTLDLFVDSKGTNADITVVDEAYVTVSHCLVGHKSTQNGDESAGLSTTDKSLQNGTDESATISKINKINSHPQAWGQCNKFLNSCLKGIERQDVSSTSRGAQMVAAEGISSRSAAISSRLAAELHGLDVLAEGIEDRKGNATRFLVLRKGRDGIEKSAVDTTAQYKTLIKFTIGHTIPGALADALAVFKTHGLNLTSINTRPSEQNDWNYVFFVELCGSQDIADQGKAVNAALRDLASTTRSYRWLGSWKSALELSDD